MCTSMEEVTTIHINYSLPTGQGPSQAKHLSPSEKKFSGHLNRHTPLNSKRPSGQDEKIGTFTVLLNLA